MIVAWQREDVLGSDLARVVPTATGWTCHGAEVLTDAACWFRVDLDPGWRTVAAEVRAFDVDGERVLRLERDGGSWTADGEPRPDLHGCLDVDVAATPLTNTFPIRRLGGLRVGEARTIAVAWVEVPSLTVVRAEHTYERTGALGWRYADDDHGAFLLEVDEDGVVQRYEGFADRV